MSLRAFIPHNLQRQAGESIELDEQESHYLVRVRRARPGQTCELLDRQGGCFVAEIAHAHPKKVELTLERHTLHPPRPHPLELWLGVPDAPALLLALARATEFGATCVRLLDLEFAQTRMPSAQRIARCLDAAMRQSGSPRPPSIEAPSPLRQALKLPWQGDSLVADPSGGATTGPAHRYGDRPCRVAIGPEGGFSAAEHQALAAAGFAPLALGPWILRSEVAVTAALARIHA